MRISDWSSDVCSSDLAGSADFLAEPVVIERGPAREPLEHAVCHVGGGGFGIGEAEDLRRMCAVGQQPDHALRSEERGEGKECGSRGRARWTTYHSNKK